MKRIKWVFYFIICFISFLLGINKILIIINSDISNEKGKASIFETVESDTTTNKIKYYNVKRVIDGDTIVILNNGVEEKIRLIGVNTPESVDPRKPVECFGIEASNYTKENILNKNIVLVQDESQSKYDKYGRTLAYVYRDDGFFLNKEIIKNGFGYEYTYSRDYKYKEDFKNAEYFAKQNKNGLWSDNSCNKK